MASTTEARSAYLDLKKGFAESFIAPFIEPCAAASAAASPAMLSDLFIYYPKLRLKNKLLPLQRKRKNKPRKCS
jgi:hypothetical protein